MSPNSASKAEQLGYTNVKVYHDGIPEWVKKNHLAISPQFVKEAWIDKDIPHVLVDVRPERSVKKGFIKGAVSIPAANVSKDIAAFPPKAKNPPIIIYDEKDDKDAKAAAMALVKAGYATVDIMTGGFEAWKAANYPVESGKPAADIVYVPKPRPGEITIEEFLKISANIPDNTLILDVRNQEEANAGMIKGARLVPDEEVLDRLAEIPKDKTIIAHCTTGVRAEMTYHKLKEKGYNVAFLNAKVMFDNGSVKIEKP